jgi:hypothetical protein
MEKILVLYVFHEMNIRVQTFFKNCIFKDKNIDFIVIAIRIFLKFASLIN